MEDDDGLIARFSSVEEAALCYERARKGIDLPSGKLFAFLVREYVQRNGGQSMPGSTCR